MVGSNSIILSLSDYIKLGSKVYILQFNTCTKSYAKFYMHC